MNGVKKEMGMSSKQSFIVPLLALASMSIAGAAQAQVDTSPPLQNVMLLVDTSGSMEFAADGSQVQCDQVDSSLPSEPKGASQKNRWTQLVEVLTGDIQQPSCFTQDRRSSAFRNEYKLGTTDAADFNYHVPYHRIVSGTTTPCTVGAGVADANAFSWGTTPFKYHLWNDASTACTNFAQSTTGLLDTYRDRMRFGLMTFDTSADAGTGLSGLTTPDYGTGSLGTWSYFLDWRTTPDCNSNSSCAKGRPAGCAATSPMEVGARNAAAPPWEGRMVPFGSPFASVSDIRATNDHIQQVLTAVRPFGATPIDGLLSDARSFLRDDGDDDYTTSKTCNSSTGEGCFGPKNDVLTKLGCRKSYVVLLTDGEPNLDLRPFCEGTSAGLDGRCPYKDKAFEIVSDLANPPSGTPIRTYVIGFAVSTVTTGQPTPVDCSQISSKGSGTSGDTFDPKGLCDPATMKPELAACCTLAKIAFFGKTTNAFFATTASQLRSAMSAILQDISRVTSSRTLPVFAPAGAAGGGSFSFFTAFRSDASAAWTGVLDRQRTQCQKDPSGKTNVRMPVDLPVDVNQGDKFADNVNAADGSHPRRFFTVIADTDASGKVWSERSIRPAIALTNPDSITTLGGTLVNGTVSDFFAPKVPATAMQVAKASCTDLPLPLTDDACATMFMKWEIAVDNTPFKSRANAFGAVYHSTPALVGAPNDFLRDESYTQFSDQQIKRPPMLYTATTDGQLHAFKVEASANDVNDSFTINTKANNELWSFLPPGVLPRIPSQYPDVAQVLLDGAPVVKDVVFTRSSADSKSGGSGAQWHTVLVAGFGAGGTGYYALDVTKPVVDATDTTTGPKMLWQLTTDGAGNRLFGKRSATPAIATLFFGPNGAAGAGAKEFAVAILPGGDSDAPLAGECDQQGTPVGEPSLVDPDFPPRAKVRCFANDPARSLTIVKLETGEIVRSFRPQAVGPLSILPRSADSQSKFTGLNAPISGQPVVFPATTGAVSDRAFIGDRDGTLWRLDFSDPDPLNWKMKLFFDAYSGQASDVGQPIATPPILSVDRIGNVSIAFSTGDQETFLATSTMKNYLWSLLESASATPPFQSKSQWFLTLNNGERVSGPMSLFASTLYYSTFKPPLPTEIDKSCIVGDSKVCGVHYLTAATPAGTGGAPSVPSINPDGTPCLPFPGAVVFGVGITQKPTCNADATFNDPYLGGGSHTGLADFTPGKFQLIIQTGPSKVGSGGGAPGSTTETGGDVNTHAMDLTPPMSPTRIDSWAAVVE